MKRKIVGITSALSALVASICLLFAVHAGRYAVRLSQIELAHKLQANLIATAKLIVTPRDPVHVVRGAFYQTDDSGQIFYISMASQ